MKLYFILFAGTLITIFSCNSPTPYDKIEEHGETMYDVNSEDSDMKLAQAKAKSTLASFDSALVSNNPNFIDFGLKVKFTEKGLNEHIWFSSIKKSEKNYIGIVDNTPSYISTIKIGDTLEINTDNISDWQYIFNNKIVGSFTTKAIRKHMSEEDRKKFDEETSNGYIE